MSRPRFTPVPNTLLFDRALSPTARLVYAALHRLVWENGCRPDEVAELPPIEAIADRIGCGKTALKRYIGELRAAGWIETIRRGRGSLRYVVHEVPRKPESGQRETPRKPESGQREGRNPANVSARVGIGGDELRDETAIAVSRRPDFDALVEVTGADVRVEAPLVQKSLTAIRRVYLDDRRPADVAADAIAEDLADEIRRRAALYRERWPEVELTPTALAKHWTRVTTEPPRDPRRVSGADLFAEAQAEHAADLERAAAEIGP